MDNRVGATAPGVAGVELIDQPRNLGRLDIAHQLGGPGARERLVVLIAHEKHGFQDAPRADHAGIHFALRRLIGRVWRRRLVGWPRGCLTTGLRGGRRGGAEFRRRPHDLGEGLGQFVQGNALRPGRFRFGVGVAGHTIRNIDRGVALGQERGTHQPLLAVISSYGKAHPGGAYRVPLLACPAVLNRPVARHCWTSQQWHPLNCSGYAAKSWRPMKLTAAPTLIQIAARQGTARGNRDAYNSAPLAPVGPCRPTNGRRGCSLMQSREASSFGKGKRNENRHNDARWACGKRDGQLPLRLRRRRQREVVGPASRPAAEVYRARGPRCPSAPWTIGPILSGRRRTWTPCSG